MCAAKALYLCGISHENASVNQIGECAVSKDECCRREKMLSEKYLFEEIVLLSTCNRVEYYFTVQGDFDCSRFLSECFGGSVESVYVKKNEQAIAHLFEVASGLRSQMTGETEILGQVKSAYSRAFSCGHCSSVLNLVFQKSAQIAKWVRTNTGIGAGKISIGSVSALLAMQIFEDITSAKILLIGSGQAGKLIAEALLVRDVRNITIASRTRGNSLKLSESLGVSSVEFSEAMSLLRTFDIIICASSGGLIITTDMVKDILKKRQNPLFLIDLSVPKNIDTKCADIDDVFLYDMRNLSEIANSNMLLRKNEIRKARDVIARKATSVALKVHL